MIKLEVEGIREQLESKGFVLYSMPRETPPHLLIMFEPRFKQFVVVVFTDTSGEYSEHHIWLHSAESKAALADKSIGAYRAAPDGNGFWWFCPQETDA